MNKYCRFILLYTLCVFSFSLCAQQYDPIADPKAIVVQDQARFTILSDRLIRMEYVPDGKFNDQATLTFVNRKLPVPDYQVKHADGWLTITTPLIVLKYKEKSGKFTAENLLISYKDPSRSFTWQPGMKDKSNLKGTTRTLDGVIGRYGIYQAHKVQLDDGILSRSGWCFIDDSQRPLFDNSDWPWVEARTAQTADVWHESAGVLAPRLRRYSVSV